jgi:serine phosphatase RsbU (regulator of sigma subunit)
MNSLRLPAPPGEPAGNLLARLRRYLLSTWRGRILLAACGLFALELAGLPVPGLFGALARIALFCYALVYGIKLGLWLLRRLLWRIRTRLLVSYLFIAVVPLVLLVAFFLLAGMLFSGLVASHLVTSELDRKGEALRRVAQAALTPPRPAAAAALRERLSPALEIHPELAFALLCDGKAQAVSGTAPRAVPAWWTPAGFVGLTTTDGRAVLRAGENRDGCTLFLDAPVDKRLYEDFTRRTGIELLAVGGEVRRKARGVQIEVNDEDFERLGTDPGASLSGMPFMATPERVDWQSGTREAEPLTFLFQPMALARRLSPPGSINVTDVLVTALTIVGLIFLVVYGVALLIGFLLARSITRSVHALWQGTLRVSQGDFEQPVRISGRDQLGQLAASFNSMAGGIRQLMVEQAEKERLEEELRIARQIQMSLLPQGTVELPGLRVSALCLPAAEVGGDYYDLLPLSPTRMGVLVADVSGKGTSAALYMAELKGLVLSLSRIYASPAKLLAEANRILAANVDSRTFVTMTYAVVDVEARTLRYARAGHNPMIHLEKRTGRTHVLTPPGIGLGLDKGERFERILQEAEVKVESGDVFLFFTDGLSEAMNARAELFGEARLRDIIERSESLSSEEIKERILEEIRVFVGGEAQHDDMTLVLLKVA